ncbi:MAG: DNA polymerase III subunit delta [Actinomycetota bacterium]
MSSPVYLLLGESFLSEEALDRIREEAGTDHLAEDVFQPDVEPAALMSALETPNLLGGRRLVVVYNAQDLKKDHLAALERYLASPSPYAVLVLVASGRNKLEALVKGAGTVISLDPPKGRKLVTWIRQRAGEHRLKIDDRGAWALIDAIGTELRDLDGSLSQLATGFGAEARIGPGQVRDMFSRLADERMYAFTDAVGDRRLPQAMTALRRLLDQGEQPLVVLGALAAQVRRMLRARRYAEQGAKAVGQAMGLPGWRAERLEKQARSYSEEELAAALSVLAETDVQMKGGDLPPEIVLETAVTRIVSGIAATAPMF